MKSRILGLLPVGLSAVSGSAMAPSRTYQRILAFAIVPVLALSHQAHAALEEVTFQASQVIDPNAPFGPLGPVTVGSLSGYFFFDTSQVTGGLRPVSQVPGAPPGAPGTAEVFFGAGPSGAETLTLNDGSRLTVPLTSGFSLFADFEAPVCGDFDDCHYTVGQVLSLNQFNAAPDPWALIFNGMNGSFNEFFPNVSVGEFLLEGSGNFQVRSVPEPGTLSLLGLGLAGVGFMRRRKNSRASCLRGSWVNPPRRTAAPV